MQQTFRASAIAILSAALIAATPAAAADIALTFERDALPPRPEPLTLGVGVHFGIGGDMNYVPERAASLIRELGFDSFRDDLAWPAFDQPGATPQNPQPAKLFEFMKLAIGVRPLLILGHALQEGQPPLTDAGRAAFTDFAVRAAMSTRDFDPIYEIWNEWNLTARFSLPFLVGPGEKDDPRAAIHYAALARATIPALRSAVENPAIVTGAVGVDAGWQWTKAIVEGGAAPVGSTLSVHLYNHCEPDVSKRTATELIDRIGALQTALAGQNGGPYPLYITEFGWPTAKMPCPIAPQTVANNIAQFMLWSAATPWIKGLWVYQLKDQGRNPEEIEDNFGLYDFDYNPKPAACAVREAIGLIKSSRGFRLERPFPDLFVLHTESRDGMRLVAWTTREETKGRLTLSGSGAVRAKPLCGAAVAGDAAQVAIGPQPVVIDITGTTSARVTASLR